MNDILREITRLRKELEHHNLLYYVNDAPEISDFEYDAMLRRLEELEAELEDCLVTARYVPEKFIAS